MLGVLKGNCFLLLSFNIEKLAAMELVYLQESNIGEVQYKNFILKYYCERFNRKIERNLWYAQLGDNYKVLLAVENGEILGQNCAYSVKASYKGRDTILWWGVDAFVLKEYRGKGIGTMLQKKLHKDLPNFTSASYSRPNGAIKRKLGANSIFENKYYYYGVSFFVGLFLSLVCTRLFGKTLFLKPKHGFPYIYSLFGSKKVSLQDAKIDNELASYMDNILKQAYDFYVKRSESYLKWKYCENPSIESKVKYVLYNNQRVGVVAFCLPKIFDVAGTPTLSIKLTDLVLEPEYEVKSRDVIYAVLKECKEMGLHIDGILSNNKINGLPAINYHNIDVLSSMEIKSPIMKPYLTLLDQDMEQ